MLKNRISGINLRCKVKYVGLICIILLGIYPGVSSAISNIVINPGFESGTIPWVFYTNGAGSFSNNGAGSGSSYSGHIIISQPGTNVQIYQAGLVLEPNTQYKMSFKAYSNTGHDVSVSLIKHGSPYTSYGLSSYEINLGTSWSDFTIQFTTSGFSNIVNDARLMFMLSQYDAAGDNFFFDDIIITKVSSVPSPPPPPTSSILSNPGFESGTLPWIFYTNGAGTFLNDVSGSASPHAGHITISQPGTNVQLNQAGLVLEPGTRYRLSFKAYSNNGHDLSISIFKNGPPYTNYGLSDYAANLGTSWSEYSKEFITSGFSGTINDARLMFMIADYDATGDQYFLDDVVLTKISSTAQVPSIISQPSSQIVALQGVATFTVAASGTTPLSFQWQKNGVNIPGATGATYSTPATTLSDNGAIFRVLVSNNLGSVTSNGATLTVISAPSNKQLVVLDVNYEHNTAITLIPPLNAISGKSASFFNIPSNVPDNLVSPIDYSHGTIYQRIQVFTKPSTKTVWYQICFFQDTITQDKHACTNRDQLAFTSTGTYFYSQPLTSIFQYSVIDWRRKLLIMMIDVADKNGILVDDRPNYNFNQQWDGYPNLNLYYPMKVRYTAIIVPSGGGAPVWP